MNEFSEGCGYAMLITALFMPFYLFGGEPDLMDAIIHWLMK